MTQIPVGQPAGAFGVPIGLLPMCIPGQKGRRIAVSQVDRPGQACQVALTRNLTCRAAIMSKERLQAVRLGSPRDDIPRAGVKRKGPAQAVWRSN